MRWQIKKIIYPREGDTRVVKRFLFFPKCLWKEGRWLEIAYMKQVYRKDPDNRHGQRGIWFSGNFVEKEEYLEYIGKSK